jgi:hypothetical protein
VGQREPYGHEVPPQAKQLGEHQVTPREVQRVYGHVELQPVMQIEEPQVMQIEKPPGMQIGDGAMESVQDSTEAIRTRANRLCPLVMMMMMMIDDDDDELHALMQRVPIASFFSFSTLSSKSQAIDSYGDCIPRRKNFIPHASNVMASNMTLRTSLICIASPLAVLQMKLKIKLILSFTHHKSRFSVYPFGAHVTKIHENETLFACTLSCTVRNGVS